MCTAVFMFGVHPRLLFLLAFNRDEFFERPSTVVHQWTDIPQIIAPRDRKRKGTWVGLSTTGRIAFLTNRRLPQSKRYPLSRGSLPVEFLSKTKTPTEFIQDIDPRLYAPLNLLTVQLFDKMEVAMFTSTHDDNRFFLLEKGIHGVSNGAMTDPAWYKVERAKIEMKKILLDLEPEGMLPYHEIFEDVMGNSIEVPPDMPLPNTGNPDCIERKFSPVRINPFWYNKPPGGYCGTVSQTVIAVWNDHTVEMHERVWDLTHTHCDQDYYIKI